MKKFIQLVFLLLIWIYSAAQLPDYIITRHDSSSPSGFYFLSQEKFLLIIDHNGDPVYYKPGARGFDFALQANGLMTYSDLNGFLFMDSTFNVIDSIRCKNIHRTDTHDIRVLPDGHFMLLGFDSANLDASHDLLKDKCYGDTLLVRATVIQEQDEQRNVVFEWHSTDHFAFSDVDTFWLKCPDTFDWTHVNSVELDTDGNILLCSRNFSEITKISRKDGSIMWRLGGNRNQFKFINCPTPFYGPHDIRRISNGHITLFDNGDHTIPHGCRALEFELDEKNKTATLKWSYLFDSSLISGGRGSVQRLPDGNTVVSFGITSNNKQVIPNNPVCFVVVDSAGSKLFQLAFTDGSSSFRVRNYPQLPFQLHRPQISCFDSLGVKYLDAGPEYTYYKWNTGETTRQIKVGKEGEYYVFVPYGQDGFISSEKFIINSLLNPCQNEGDKTDVKNKKRKVGETR